MTRHKTRRVFICSRYAGDIERNEKVARALCQRAMDAGFAPFAPHLLYTQFLDDSDPQQREIGISAGLHFLRVCDVVWVYVGDGISDGMRREIECARRLNKPVIEIWNVQPCVQS